MNSERTTEVNEALPPPTRPRRKWLTLLFGILIFAAGLACGAGLTVVTVVHRLQYAVHHPEGAPARIAARLTYKLGLNDEQHAQVLEILTKGQSELMGIRRQFQPQVMGKLEQIRDEISDVLTEPQREHWTKMFDELRDRWLPPLPAAEKKDRETRKQGDTEKN
jgi:hypothetical protein